MAGVTEDNNAQGVTQIIVCSVFLALAILAVSLRVWSRKIKKMSFGMNDYAIFCALIFTAALIATLISAVVASGVGEHEEDVDADQTTYLLKAFVTGEMLWGVANTSVKVSVLHLYISIFPNTPFRVIAYTIMAIVVMYGGSILLECILLCQPFAYNWDKTIVGGYCGNQQLAYMIAGVVNLGLDVVIIILPLPMLWRLQLAVSKKIALSMIFSLGGFICVVTVLRIVTYQKLDLEDFTYSVAPVGMWSALEPTLGIVNACLPVMRPVVSRISNSPLLTWTKNGTSTANVEWTGVSSKRFSRPDEAYTKSFNRHFRIYGYPASDTNSLENQISSSCSDNNDDQRSMRMIEPPLTAITVTKDWTVHSEAAV